MLRDQLTLPADVRGHWALLLALPPFMSSAFGASYFLATKYLENIEDALIVHLGAGELFKRETERGESTPWKSKYQNSTY